jgi:riboflavin biosynthesis pyrimidine reductase
MIGRISMEPYAGKTKVPRRKAPQKIPRTDFIARRDAEAYAVALDPSGKLTWRSGSIDEEHVVSILTEKVPDDYLAFLRAKGVSYLFGGKMEVDLERALQKLRSAFGIKRLLLEGGGKINGTFLAAGLIDELSILVAPIADGGIGTPSLFDAREGKGLSRQLKLVSFERCRGDVMWLRYKVKR